ncbi:MAG: hypothetical protein IT438_10425 [Phycisphaerales bacterium]|nr:hypothetical protein [Phycisphaerales bacterium]
MGDRALQSGAPRRIARHCFLAAAVFGAVCAALWLVNARFPYVRSGATLVTEMKRGLAEAGRPFARDGSLRVMAFGSSKTLSGFIPDLFDREAARLGVAGVESYNFGLPGEFAFVEEFEAMVDRGAGPDVALLIIPWPAEELPAPSVLRPITHNRPIIDAVFPFRKLPRDAFIMATESGFSPSRFRAAYAESERTVKQVALDRGYYFIARQSHYANDQLPAAFTAPTDTPGQIAPRVIPRGPVFDRISKLCRERGVRCIYVPSYFREGQYAPARGHNPEAASVLAGHDEFAIVGPDYLLYPNRLFSDPIHTNRVGAEDYTRAIAALVAPELKKGRAAP